MSDPPREPLTDDELDYLEERARNGVERVRGPHVLSLVAEVRRLRSRGKEAAVNESDLSGAYLRLRALIPGAFDTPHAPSAEQVWATTERALIRLRSDEWLVAALEEISAPYFKPSVMAALPLLRKHRDGAGRI